MTFWLVLKLEISYRVMISWSILVYFRGIFWRLYFCMVKCLSFHYSFALKILFNVNGKAIVWHTPCCRCGLVFKGDIYDKIWWMKPATTLQGNTWAIA
jgi:hypothetical protein